MQDSRNENIEMQGAIESLTNKINVLEGFKSRIENEINDLKKSRDEISISLNGKEYNPYPNLWVINKKK